MKKIAMNYTDYLLTHGSSLDYVMIDPPWNYGMQGSKLQTMTERCTNYSYWAKNNEEEVLEVLEILSSFDVKAVAMWVTLPMLNAVMGAVRTRGANKFEFRSMITWIKRNPSGKAAPVVAHYFLNSTEYLVIMVNKSCKKELNRTKIQTHYDAVRGQRTVKPKDLESSLMNSWPGKWAYVFSGPFVDELTLEGWVDLDCVDTCFNEDLTNE